MKVVFLDFDGVVIVMPKERTELEWGKLVRAANKAAVANLNAIIERTGAKVVVSSTWRLHHDVPMLTGTLRRAGFVGEVIGVTPDRNRWGMEGWRRGHEIEAWLKLHPQVTSYVALDDDDDIGPLPPERWVLVKRGWYEGGLKPEHVEQACAMLAVPIEVAA